MEVQEVKRMETLFQEFAGKCRKEKWVRNGRG